MNSAQTAIFLGSLAVALEQFHPDWKILAAKLVIPAKAGIQGRRTISRLPWTPAFAGVTG